eukprot:63035_1
MLTLLLITSLFTVGYTNKCPDGTQQIGSGGAAGAVQSGSSKTRVTIEDCKYYCLEMQANCKSFSFDTDVNNAGLSLCIPYRLDRIAGVISNHPRADQVLCAMEMCPLGTAQIGPDGSVGSRQVAAPRNGLTIEGCRDYCRSGRGCESFLYDDNYKSNSGYSDLSLRYSSCILYGEDDVSTVLPDTHYYADALLCALYDSDTVICPHDTTQIATTGSFFYAPMVRYYTGFSKEVCRNACNYYRDCTAFAYDSDYGRENVGPSLCRLYNANSNTRIGQYPSGRHYSDTILCATRIFSAQAPDVFSFDVNEKFTEISGNYVIYIIGFVGIMVVVNAICVMMYCWNKLKRNEVNYKLVSMRSDAETDVEHQ